MPVSQWHVLAIKLASNLPTIREEATAECCGAINICIEALRPGRIVVKFIGNDTMTDAIFFARTSSY